MTPATIAAPNSASSVSPTASRAPKKVARRNLAPRGSARARENENQDCVRPKAVVAKSTTIAVVNQKGGVGKTTVAVNLAAALVEAKRRVILIDLDPQRDCMAFEHSDEHPDPPANDAECDDAMTQSAERGVLFFASDAAELPGLIEDYAITNDQGIENADGAEIIILDCPPALGVEVAAALQIAHFALVPVNAEYSSLRGLARLLETLSVARASGNATLRAKVLLTMFDSRVNHCHAVATEARRIFGPDVLQTRVARSYAFADAALSMKPILQHAPRSVGAAAFRELAQEVSALCDAR